MALVVDTRGWCGVHTQFSVFYLLPCSLDRWSVVLDSKTTNNPLSLTHDIRKPEPRERVGDRDHTIERGIVYRRDGQLVWQIRFRNHSTRAPKTTLGPTRNVNRTHTHIACPSGPC